MLVKVMLKQQYLIKCSKINNKCQANRFLKTFPSEKRVLVD